MNLKRFLSLRKHLAGFDFIVTYPARGLAVSVRYDPAKASLPEGMVLGDPLRDILLAARFAGRPVLLWPALADVMAELLRNQMSGPSCRRRLALAMAHLRRRHPLRFRRKWRLKEGGQHMAQTLFRRWMFRAVCRADFVVWGLDGAAALKYSGGPGPPRVLAMGAGKDGRLIRSLTGEHGVLAVEDQPCVQALLDEAWPCEHVPEECWDSLINVMRTLSETHPGFLSRWKCLHEDDSEGEEWKKAG
jgi:type III secretion system FlhB-like substrate exporter